MFEHLLPPIFQRLEESQRVLIAGMGGGFDLFGALRAQGKHVELKLSL